MRTMLLAALVGLVCGLAVAYAQAVSFKAAEAYMPEVVTIKKELSDRARICVEPVGGGLLSCRPIGELRKWAVEGSSKSGK